MRRMQDYDKIPMVFPGSTALGLVEVERNANLKLAMDCNDSKIAASLQFKLTYAIDMLIAETSLGRQFEGSINDVAEELLHLSLTEGPIEEMTAEPG